METNWADAYRATNNVTWYNPQAFNGVLFLMREPNNESNDTDPVKITEGNWKWFSSLLKPTAKDRDETKGKKTRYHNRFEEMLNALPIADKNLEHVAYANLHIYGGGKANSKEYQEILNDKDKRTKEMKRIYQCIPQDKIQYIITCRDIFDRLSDQDTIKCGTGFTYEKCVSRTGKTDGIVLIEMIKHPCISPKIKPVQIHL